MRWIVKIVLGLVVGLVLAWSLWWWIAGFGVRTGVAAWFEDQRARGWQAEYAGIATSGYPARHSTRLDQPALADPATGVAWRADWLTLDSPAARPSIFNDDEEFGLLTTHDELLLQMLYDPRLTPGMTAAEAAPIARVIAREYMEGRS